MTNCLLHRRRRWDCELLCALECVFECVRAVIVSLMLGVCAVLAHVRGLSNLIGDTSCLSCAPLFIIPPLHRLGKKKVLIPISLRLALLRSYVSLSLSVTNKHITMKQPRRRIATWRKNTNILIIACYICVIFELSVLREKWIKSTKW